MERGREGKRRESLTNKIAIKTGRCFLLCSDQLGVPMNYYPCLFEQAAEAIRFTVPSGWAGNTRVTSSSWLS